MKNISRGWAIDTGEIGLLFKGVAGRQIPDALDGYQVAVWHTKKRARESLIRQRAGRDDVWPQAQIVKVMVTVAVTADASPIGVH